MNEFVDEAALVLALSTAIATQLRAGIETRGSAYLVVSGGRSPVPLFRALSAAEIDFSKVTILLADERWVPRDHADSNARLVAEHLCQDRARAATLLQYYRSGVTLEAQVQQLDPVVGQLPIFDAVVLGMGLDGHTASLFPDTKALTEGLNLASPHSVLAVKSLSAPHARLTLTAARLLRTHSLYLPIIGHDKRRVLLAAAKAEIERLPIGRFLQQSKASLEVYWAA